jgi:O-antigen ligase
VFPRDRIAIVLCVLAVGGLGTTYLASNPEAWQRLTQDEHGGSGREDLWTVAARIARDNPILGVGIYNYRVASPSYVREPGALRDVRLIVRGQEAHNVYLTMLVEVGPLGLLLYVSVPFLVLRAALRAGRRYDAVGRHDMSVLCRSAFVGLTGALTTSFFLPNPADKRLWVLMAVIVALANVALRITNARAREEPEAPLPARRQPVLAAVRGT